MSVPDPLWVEMDLAEVKIYITAAHLRYMYLKLHIPVNRTQYNHLLNCDPEQGSLLN